MSGQFILAAWFGFDLHQSSKQTILFPEGNTILCGGNQEVTGLPQQRRLHGQGNQETGVSGRGVHA